MRRSGCSKGGMQSNAAHYSIFCEKCGKVAARYEPEKGWMHFTKHGCIWHKPFPRKPEEGEEN